MVFSRGSPPPPDEGGICILHRVTLTRFASMAKRAQKPASPLFKKIIELEAHHRAGVALVAGVIGAIVAAQFARISFALILGWDVFALVTLILAWLGMLRTDAKTRVREAHLQDSNLVTICACVVFAGIAGFVSAGLLLGSAKSLAGTERTTHVALAVTTVVLSWLLVHTVMALRYTHMYYCTCEDSLGRGGFRGLLIPETKDPDYLDFAYVSFVIGMTCQVSDVQVTARSMRRLIFLHSVLSFCFNTVIVAFAINLASSLF